MTNTVGRSEIEVPAAVTVGTFDGVHLGHQKILTHLKKIAKNKQLKSVVLTFFPHPRSVLEKDTSIKLINTIEERKRKLLALGIDEVVIEPFTKTFANLSAEEYIIKILIERLNTKHIIIGYNHKFGKNRRSSIKELRLFGKQFNFEVEEISVKDIEKVSVSSTKIRNALLDGKIQLANSYLGYAYFFTGVIVKGKGLGKTLGFPTANIHIKEDYKLIPKNGVYIVSFEIETIKGFGMMNIGTNPTVNGSSQSIEVHFFDFNKEVYGCPITISVLKRMRDECKFNTIDLLQSQLHKDLEEAKTFINANFS